VLVARILYLLLFGVLLLPESVTSQTIIPYKPLHQGSVNGNSVTFEWRTRSQDGLYTLELDTDSLFGMPQTFPGIQSPHTVNGLTSDVTYWWRITGSNGTSSPARKFRLINLATNSLVQWFSADQGVTTVSGLVSGWNDQGSLQNHASQPAPGLQPSLVMDGFGGLPTIHFGKTGGPGNHTILNLNSTVSFPAANFTLFTMHKLQNSSNVLAYILGGVDNGLFAGGSLSGGYSVGLFDGVNARRATGAPYLNWAVHSYKKNQIWRNGSGLPMTGTPLTSFSYGQMGIQTNYNNLYFYGDLSEFLAYNQSLPDSQRIWIENYLINKYARPVRLPKDTTVCGPSITLSIPGGTDEYSSILWSTGSTAASINVTANGTYWVLGVSRLGPITSDTIHVDGILPIPVMTPTNDQNICLNRDTVTFTNLTANPNFTFLWSTGETANSIQVSNGQPVFLSAFDTSSGCILTTDTVHFFNKTRADFASLPVCPGADALFTDLSLDLSGDTISNWRWNFGDPGTLADTSNLQNGMWNYAQSGIYPVSLYVEASDGCKDSIVKMVQIKPTATPDFNWQGLCYGRPTQFFDQSVPENGTQVTGYFWDFGNGLSSSFVNPTVTYSTGNVYNVTLTIYTASGCNESVTLPVAVNKGALADFSISDTLCISQPADAVDLSQGINDNITQWIWRFGSNPPVSGQNPTAFFQTTGNRPVRLTVTTSSGCKDSLQKTVFVKPSPTALFQLNSGGGNPPVAPIVENNSTGATSFQWFVNGELISSAQEPEFPVFTDTGVYTLTLISTNADGCSDIFEQPFTVFTGVRSLDLIQASCIPKGDYMGYTAQILNNGMSEVQSISLEGRTDYNTKVTETWNGSLMPGQVLNYTFVSESKVFTSKDFCCVKILSYNDSLSVLPPDDQICTPLVDGPVFFSAYPTPSDQFVHVDFILPFAGTLNADLFSAEGKHCSVVLSNLAFEAGFGSFSADLSALKAGIYSFRITYRDKNYFVKVLKK
jgi:PKD repeat protein